MQNPAYKLKFYYLVILSLQGALLYSVKANADFSLGMPIDCDFGTDCYIQNYVDVNSSNGYADYKCGFLSYDKHKGTDFRLLDYQQLTKGIKAIAVADGVVKAVRTDEPDFAFIEQGLSAVADKECGNGIVITHPDGYSTQYCHLLRNTIIVTPGDRIKKGDKIGFVGMSGETEFPHLHLSVTKNDEIIDPFTGLNPQPEYFCNEQKSLNPLWDKKTQAKLAYTETAILSFYATGKVPTQLAARAGKYREDKITQSADKIVFWTDIMGIFKNDNVVFELADASGKSIFKHIQKVPKKYVLYFAYSGKKLNDTSKIKPGKYTATISIYRKNTLLTTKNKVVEVV